MITLRNNQRSVLGWGLGLQWVVATTVSWVLIVLLFGVLSLGAGVRQAVSETVGFSVGFAIGGAIAGAVVGLAQWLVLRRQVSQAGWWVLASSLSLAVLFVVSDALGGNDVTSGRAVVAFVVAGVLAGAITGSALVRLLRQPVAKAEARG